MFDASALKGWRIVVAKARARGKAQAEALGQDFAQSLVVRHDALNAAFRSLLD